MPELSQEQINQLLGPPKSVAKPTAKSKWPPREEQRGPVRWFDKEMRCSSRGCSSSTYIQVEGVPRCMMHAIHILNELVLKLQDAGQTTQAA